MEMASGYSAMVCALFIGKRKHVPENRNNVPFILLGTSIIWFGWFGFNAGGALSSLGLVGQIFVTTNSAAAGAMITWLLWEFMRDLPPSVEGSCHGIVVGLVAITPGCAFVTVQASFFIGCTAIMVCIFVKSYVLERISQHLDDSLDVLEVHGVAGTVGVIFTGIFCSPLVDGECGSVWTQLLGMTCLNTSIVTDTRNFNFVSQFRFH